jgi:hypothetical protein
MLRTSHDNITTSLLKVYEKLQPQHRKTKDSDMEKYIQNNRHKNNTI